MDIIAKLAEAGNNNLRGVIDNAHFNDEAKLGSGKEMVDKLSDLIAIFQRPEFDFKNNKAAGDDILGDAYEYLIGQFAAGSGQKAGEFYTPQMVSNILSKIVTLDCQDPKSGHKSKIDKVLDFACGSGSLLLNVRKEMGANAIGKIYGQEKNITTYNLARMNMLLHGVKDPCE